MIHIKKKIFLIGKLNTSLFLVEHNPLILIFGQFLLTSYVLKKDLLLISKINYKLERYTKATYTNKYPIVLLTYCR